MCVCVPARAPACVLFRFAVLVPPVLVRVCVCVCVCVCLCLRVCLFVLLVVAVVLVLYLLLASHVACTNIASIVGLAYMASQFVFHPFCDPQLTSLKFMAVVRTACFCFFVFFWGLLVCSSLLIVRTTLMPQTANDPHGLTSRR